MAHLAKRITVETPKNFLAPGFREMVLIGRPTVSAIKVKECQGNTILASKNKQRAQQPQ